MGCYNIHVKGLVQGVGFRPFVYRTARDLQLTGTVYNATDGVYISVSGTKQQAEELATRLLKEKPSVAEIKDIDIIENKEDAYLGLEGFYIVKSLSREQSVTRISPDIAICEDCIKDADRQPHRLHYPFINCTHCGPRFSIIQGLPYDRPNTTMSEFRMCEVCAKEYKHENDRRFHAQPVACNHCGPKYTLYDIAGNITATEYDNIISLLVKGLSKGNIIALKGIGGYSIICDALHKKAIVKLRKLKNRPRKPFIVMIGDDSILEKFVWVNKEEQSLLKSWRRPIVLLSEKKKLTTEINGTYSTLGVMLPYMLIHYDLLSKLPSRAIVVTSGNLYGEPIVKDNDKAFSDFIGKCDFILDHNRKIFNRSDDSVTHVIDGMPRIIRRARGYTPEPLENINETEGILATGAEQIGAFAIGKGKEIILSQYLGDQKRIANRDFRDEAFSHFQQLFKFSPRCIAADMHPDYTSTQWAENMASQMNIPIIKIQHHHAHAVSVMVEYRLKNPVLSVCLDGTGYGDDGCVWGGEIMKCDRISYERLSHFSYLPLPGGDAAIREPWRMVVSMLHIPGEKGTCYPEKFVRRIGRDRIAFIENMIDHNVNCPLSSGAGRLFDAVSSLLGICDMNSYSSEAAISLEQVADANCNASYHIDNTESGFDFRWLIRRLCEDYEKGISEKMLASMFHNTLTKVLNINILRISQKENISTVVLSGGVFQNKILCDLLLKKIKNSNIKVYLPSSVPCNDAGIPVGQLAIASAVNNTNFNKLCTNYLLP